MGFGRRYLTRGRRHARAVGLVVLSLCLAAFAIDGARLLVEQRHLQNAVDAAALAAARIFRRPARRVRARRAVPRPSAKTRRPTATATAAPTSRSGPATAPPTRLLRDPVRPQSEGRPGADHRDPWHLLSRETRSCRPGDRLVVRCPRLGSAGHGLPSSTVTNVSGGSEAALFASNTSCAAVDIEAATATVNGTILTNGGIKPASPRTCSTGP